MDLLVAICLLPLLRFNMRYCVSPLFIAADVSESGFRVVRSSTLTLAGSDELSLWALSTAAACDQLSIIELNASIGDLRRSVELTERAVQPHCPTRSNRISCRSMADWRNHPARSRFDQRSLGHPRAKNAKSFIMWDGSRVSFARQLRTQRSQLRSTVTHP